MTTASWNILHHFTRPLVLSAVFRCTRSRTTMYDCSSFTCAKASESLRTRRHQSINIRPFLADGCPALTFSLEGVLWHLGFGHVDNSVDVERDLLGVRCPAFVAEAVVVFSIGHCGEGVVIGGDGLLEVLAVSQGILDLDASRPIVSLFILKQLQLSLCIHSEQDIASMSPMHCAKHSTQRGMSGERPKHWESQDQGVHTQKSTSRFPLPPNSRSPTWKVIVMTSSRCRDSWKHSREWALSWMVCAVAAVIHPSAVTRMVLVENRMVNVIGAWLRWI